jgi:hypothetical protein
MQTINGIAELRLCMEKTHHSGSSLRWQLRRKGIKKKTTTWIDVSALFSMVARSFQEAFQMRRRING